MLELVEETYLDHLSMMADHFGADLKAVEDSATIRLDNDWGKGTIGCTGVFPGLTVWAYNVLFHKHFEVELALSEQGPIYFCYNSKGHYAHRFGDEDTLETVLENQNMIIKGSPGSKVSISFPTGTKLEIAVIVVDLKELDRSEARNAKRMSRKLGIIFDKVPKDRSYRYLGGIQPLTAMFASTICNCEGTTLASQLATEGAVLNMLATQIRDFESGKTLKGRASVLTRTELSRISSLGRYVMDNLQEEISVSTLCEHYGTNSKKLQIGAKHLFGDTVSRYVSNVRLGHAKHLLIDSDLNVSQVAHEVGIPNIAYFSLMFKKRFGIRPSMFRKLNKG